MDKKAKAKGHNVSALSTSNNKNKNVKFKRSADNSDDPEDNYAITDYAFVNPVTNKDQKYINTETILKVTSPQGHK